MALSGSVTTTSHTGRSVTLNWNATQNISNNTSTLSWELVGSGSGSGWVVVSELRVTINGTQEYYRNSSNHTNCYQGTVLASGTKTLTHNSDGTKSFTIKVEAGIYQWAINCSGSGTFTLNSIARSSSITSVSAVTLGNACSVSWIPSSALFRYKLKFSLGNWSYTTGAIHPNKTSTFTYSGYTIPLTVANQLPKSSSGTMTVYLYTYSNSACTTQIGSTSSKTFTVTVPNTIIPTLGTVTAKIVNENSVINNWGIAVAGYTKVNISASASGTYGATINSYVISGSYNTTQSGTKLNYTGPIISSSGNKVFTIISKDSRGRNSVSKSTTAITFYAYSLPKITLFSVSRSSSNAKSVIVKANWTYSTVNGKNNATAKLYYKKSNATNWTEYGTISKNISTTLSISFEETSSYNFKVIVKDSLSKTAQDEGFISTIEVTMDFKAGGKGVAFGKIAETNNMVESAWHTRAPFYSVSSIGRPWINLNGVSGQYGINLANSDVINARRIIFGTEADGDEGLFFPKEGKDINDKDTESYMRLRAYRDKIYFRDSTGEHRVIHTGDLMNTPYFKFDSDRFWFAAEGDPHQYALHLNNSDIVGANAIVFNDAVEMSTNEGIWFPYANKTMNSTNMGDYMRLWAYEGVLYFRNGSAGAQTNNVVYHAGNIRNFASSGAGWMKVGSYKVCWGTVKIAYACETASGSIYYGNATSIANQNFASAFSAKPVCVMTLKTMSAGILGIDAFDVQSGGIANVRLKRATPYTDTSGIEAFYVAYGPA